MYLAIHTLHKTDRLKSDWLRNIETLLCSLGFSGIWQSQYCDNYNWLRLALKQKLKDLYIQKWFTSSSGCNFRLFKINFERSKYLHFSQIICLNHCWNLGPEITNFRLRLVVGPEFRFQKENASSVLMMSVMSITICYVVSISVLKELDSLNHITLKEQTP